MADLIDRKAARQIVAAYSTAEGVEKALNAIAALPAQGVHDTATWNNAIQKAAGIAHSGVEAYGAKMRAATDKKEKRDWQSMLMAAVDIEHAILAALTTENQTNG